MSHFLIRNYGGCQAVNALLMLSTTVPQIGIAQCDGFLLGKTRGGALPKARQAMISRCNFVRADNNKPATISRVFELMTALKSISTAQTGKISQ
jgi:hypothetical protein